MTTGTETPAEVVETLRRHADRAVTGRLRDPAAIAAVAGVERIAMVLGTFDPAALEAAIAAPAALEDPEVAALVAEVQERVQSGIARREARGPVNSGVLNLEAGGHPITRDAALLRAGVRAAHRSFEEMPYYRLRYGDRGARFAVGDSAWLLDLAAVGLDEALRQVTWLTRVLAARGMPSWLMERHLDLLVAEATAHRTGHLPEVADHLRAQRSTYADDGLLAAADEWVLATLAEPPVARAGALLAAAGADVAAGVARDDGSLFDWLTDPERVSATDAAALHDVRTRIREAIGSA